jgi:hypothetical protein
MFQQLLRQYRQQQNLTQLKMRIKKIQTTKQTNLKKSPIVTIIIERGTTIKTRNMTR